MKVPKPFVQLVLFSAIITLILVVLSVVSPALIQWFTWATLMYFIGVTFLTNFLMNRGTATNDPYDFYNYTMSSVAIRLLVSAGLLFGYYYKFDQHVYLFTFTFFILYFLFTGFEIRLQLSKLRQKKGSSDNTHEKI